MDLAPLDGFVVGVTADRRVEEQSELLRRRGAVVLHGPAIATNYLVDDEPLRAATAAVIEARPRVLLATTGIGIRAWFEAAQTWDLADALLDALADTTVLARGPKAASAVVGVGLSVTETVPDERLSSLVSLALGHVGPGDPVAVQCHGGDPAGVFDALPRAVGRPPLEVVVYRWRLPDDRTPALRLVEEAVAGRLDALTFTSAPAAANLVAIARDAGLESPLLHSPAAVVCVGPVCGEAVQALGFRPPVVGRPARLGGMIRALSEHLVSRRRQWDVDGVPVVAQGRTVLVGDDRVTLSPRERAVFDVLAERPGVVVPRALLRRAAWPGEAVGEHVLEVTVTRMRRKLGALGAAVQAVPRRGYRLVVAPVAGSTPA